MKKPIKFPKPSEMKYVVGRLKERNPNLFDPRTMKPHELAQIVTTVWLGMYRM